MEGTVVSPFYGFSLENESGKSKSYWGLFDGLFS